MKGQRTHTVPYLLPKSTATDRCPVPPHSARTCNWVNVLSRPGRRRGPSPRGRSRRHEQQCLQAAMTPSTRSPGPRPDWLTQQIVGRSLMQFRFRGTGGNAGEADTWLLSTKRREGQNYLNAIEPTRPLCINNNWKNNVSFLVCFSFFYRSLKENLK